MESNWERKLKSQIRRRYAKQSKTASEGKKKAINIGYPPSLLGELPSTVVANYSGCGYLFNGVNFNGNEIVIDLGCGSGLDSYISSKYLNTGKVISIDMTFEALSKNKVQNILPLCADIEFLPISDHSADIVIANACFNLTISKKRAFEEAFRILRNNGRLVIRDLVKVKELPPEVISDPLSYSTSLGGVLDEQTLISIINKTGFTKISCTDYQNFSYVQSIKIEATKPS